jgi:murein L,D-transpeptidase YafK
MTTRLLLAIALTLGVSSCSKSEPQSATEQSEPEESAAVPVFTKQDVPSSRRSRNAIARVAPSLIGALESNNLTYGSPVFIRIFKEEKELEVWVRQEETFELFRTYSIVAMSGHLGPKLREGDRQAPEGFYFVTPSRINPNSRFHLSFNLGYPNTYDRAHKRTGSALMIHGNRVSIGCFAMTDPKIEEIYCLADAALRNGQKFFRVHCFPFRMTTENMKKHSKSEWISFWENLKIGYDSFEETKQPPHVRVRNKKYIFEKAKD